MSPTSPHRRHLILAAPALLLAACATPEPPPPAAAPAAAAPPPEPVPSRADAKIELRHWQLGAIGQVGWGGGTLIYGKRRLAFRWRTVGVGGVGMSRVRADGEVFNLSDVTRFPGVYGLVRAGVTAPGAELTRAVWLENTNGVRIRLVPQRTGLALALGADGVLIEMR